MSELDKLEFYLKEHGIRYKRIDEPAFIPMLDHGDVGRHQIVVYDEEGGKKWDAICQFGSYGYEEGLLEIYGDIVEEEYDDDVVIGWLTADDVIERMETNNKAMSSEQITYTSNNGYTGILYGRTSYAVFDSNGREVFHTGSRAINTLEELKKQVDNFPELHEMLLSLFHNKEDEEND